MSQDLSIMLTMDPPGSGGKVVVNSTVAVQCVVNVRIVDYGDVVWYRRQGVNRYQLSHTMRTIASRYQLATVFKSSSTATYRLTITGVQVADSATYECAAGRQSMRKASQVLAVCAQTCSSSNPWLSCREGDFRSALCDCILKFGWVSPDCIYSEDSDDGYSRALTGLGICLAVTLLFAAIATAVVICDCRQKLKEERLKEAERDASLAHSAAVISSQTAASSAIRIRPSSAAVASKPTVRFTDADISC